MTKTKAWALVHHTRKANMIAINAQMPIYWLKKVALEQAEIYKCDVVEVEVTPIQE